MSAGAVTDSAEIHRAPKLTGAPRDHWRVSGLLSLGRVASHRSIRLRHAVVRHPCHTGVGCARGRSHGGGISSRSLGLLLATPGKSEDRGQQQSLLHRYSLDRMGEPTRFRWVQDCRRFTGGEAIRPNRFVKPSCAFPPTSLSLVTDQIMTYHAKSDFSSSDISYE